MLRPCPTIGYISCDMTPAYVCPYPCHAAALCRRLYNRPGLGVGHFETSFGGRQRRRGAAPEIHAKAAGKGAGIGNKNWRHWKLTLPAHGEGKCRRKRSKPMT